MNQHGCEQVWEQCFFIEKGKCIHYRIFPLCSLATIMQHPSANNNPEMVSRTVLIDSKSILERTKIECSFDMIVDKCCQAIISIIRSGWASTINMVNDVETPSGKYWWHRQLNLVALCWLPTFEPVKQAVATHIQYLDAMPPLITLATPVAGHSILFPSTIILVTTNLIIGHSLLPLLLQGAHQVPNFFQRQRLFFLYGPTWMDWHQCLYCR